MCYNSNKWGSLTCWHRQPNSNIMVQLKKHFRQLLCVQSWTRCWGTAPFTSLACEISCSYRQAHSLGNICSLFCYRTTCEQQITWMMILIMNVYTTTVKSTPGFGWWAMTSVTLHTCRMRRTLCSNTFLYFLSVSYIFCPWWHNSISVISSPPGTCQPSS